MDNQDKLKQLISVKGPVIPSDVYSQIGLNLLITSALMAEMVSKKTLKISAVKIGASPLYYLPGQEAKLQNFSKNLHEKEKKAYELLKEKKSLRDAELEPLTRVALREIKDFAIPLTVKHRGNSEIFWKWYLISNEEAEKIIKKEIGIKEPKEETKTQQPIPEKQPTPKKESTLEQKKIKEDAQSEIKTTFFNKLDEYFTKNRIITITKETNKRKTELNFVIELPSAVGNLKYFCRAKDKKKINDADLASAFIQGQQNKLPVLFLTTGELTKKANKMLNKEFKGIHINKL